jgi:NosR/NirI family nitrous oxide reductase transcriptional regulator
MIKRLFVVLTFVMSAFVTTEACDFNFSVAGNKANCRAGEVVEVKVELVLTHRVCNVAPSQTKFKIDGVKVIAASSWKQTSANRFERTVKMQVLNDGKKKITLMAYRTCDKEGGSGSISLPKV